MILDKYQSLFCTVLPSYITFRINFKPIKKKKTLEICANTPVSKCHMDHDMDYVVVKTIMGQRYLVTVVVDITTVWDLKRVVAGYSGLPPERQILVCNYRELSDEHSTLKNAGVVNGSTITLLLAVSTGFQYF